MIRALSYLSYLSSTRIIEIQNFIYGWRETATGSLYNTYQHGKMHAMTNVGRVVHSGESHRFNGHRERMGRCAIGYIWSEPKSETIRTSALCNVIRQVCIHNYRVRWRGGIGSQETGVHLLCYHTLTNPKRTSASMMFMRPILSAKCFGHEPQNMWLAR